MLTFLAEQHLKDKWNIEERNTKWEKWKEKGKKKKTQPRKEEDQGRQEKDRLLRAHNLRGQSELWIGIHIGIESL